MFACITLSQLLGALEMLAEPMDCQMPCKKGIQQQVTVHGHE